MLLPTQDENAPLSELERQAIVHTWEQSKWNSLSEKLCKEQIAKLERLGYYKGLPTSIEEALNSGDGTYRP